jgi:hypothetical protein
MVTAKSVVSILAVFAGIPISVSGQGVEAVRRLTSVSEAVYAVASEPRWSVSAAGEHPFEKVAAVTTNVSVIAVADGQALAIHLFDLNGRYLESLGREGEGPGEFRQISTVFALDDAGFMAVDLWPSTHRLTMVDLDGELGPPEPLRAPFANVVGVLPDGRFLGTTSPASLAGRLGIVKHHLVLYAFDSTGEVRELDRLPGMEVYLAESSNGMIIDLDDLPFLAQTFVTTHPVGFVAANSRTGEVTLYTTDGSAKAQVVVQLGELELSVGDWRDYFEWYASSLPKAFQPQARTLRRGVELPSTWNSVAGLLTDDSGNVWIKRFAPPHKRDGSWLVFSSELDFRGQVRLPSEFTPFVVASDVVIGVRKDVLDVEHLEAYALAPPFLDPAP